MQKPPLNQGQQKVHDRAVDYIMGTGENLPRILLITGFGGTGKTFTFSYIIETVRLLDKNKRWSQRMNVVAATAPTHKAVRVMRKSGDLGEGIIYATIHSLLGYKMDADKKTGKLVPSRDPEDGKIAEVNLLVIDEVSQLNKELWGYIMDALDQYNFKLIILGDEVQIPPVKEQDTLPFLKPADYGIEIVALTESMRQNEDNPILAYVTAIRNSYKTHTIDPALFARVNDKGEGIILHTSNQVREIDTILEDYFGSDHFRADADYMKVVCWSGQNHTAGMFNKKIRRMLYAVPEGMLGLPMLVHGEKIIMNDSYVIPNTQGRILANNEELEVVSYEIFKKVIRYKLWTPIGHKMEDMNPQVYDVKVRYKDIDGRYVGANIRVIHEKDIQAFNDLLDKLSKNAMQAPFGQERTEMWRQMWVIKGMFAQVGYNYALTAHKAQGSTYQNCMMVYWDMQNNPRLEEKNRIMYVAGSRAREKLFIIK